MPNSSFTHEQIMKRCLELASKGLGQVAPNPMVGAVLMNDGIVIGEGYHIQFGQSHAEANAINSVNDQSLIAGSTLYVNLEPCVHVGKTPPCCDFIIAKEIARVVIGTTDPNPIVRGKGIEKLRKNGIEVITDILARECHEINRRFFTFHNKNRPYLILKWAQTQDGFIDIKRKPGDPVGINWISNTLSQTLDHRWRSEEQAIMVGTNTILLDNPQLNVRHWEGKDPLRIILDRTLRIPSHYHVMDHSLPTLVFNEQMNKKEINIEYIRIEFGRDLLPQLFKELLNREIQSVIIEGGKILLDSLIHENLWDETRVFIGDKYFGSGYSAPVLNIEPDDVSDIANNKLLYFRNHYA